MTWQVSWRADPVGQRIADRHYNRQSVGSAQFVPPGRCVVLLADDNSALWVTSWQCAQYVRHQWPDAWVNSLLRNEGEYLSSDLITAAVAATRAKWDQVPSMGIVSFVDPSKVRRKRDPGRCYLRAGWHLVGVTAGGLLVFQQLPDEMPDAVPAVAPLALFGPDGGTR